MVLVLLVASTTHRQSYKQQIKATKNSRARALKQRAKRELAATIERTQETLIMELSLKRNDYQKFYIIKEATTGLIYFNKKNYMNSIN